MGNGSDLLLVVDSDETGLQQGRALAALLGCECVTASSSAELREVLALRSPTVALVAIDMSEDQGVGAMLMLAATASRSPTLVFGDVDARVLASARRLADQHGLPTLGALQRPLSLDQAEQLIAPALRNGQLIAEAELRQALDEQQLLLYFQPQVALTSGAVRVRGAEALVRWKHPERGLLYPAQFLPSFEQAGLIGALTDTVITEALRQAGGWNRIDNTLAVTVNLSPRLVRDRQFPARLALLLREFELDPQQLLIDVTEEPLRRDYERILDVFTRLRIMNVDLVLDHFGTGYSSLTELYRMPFTEVKLDQSLIAELPHNREACIVVETLATLAHRLNLKACAAGVETDLALETLRSYDFDYVQGQALCEPVPAADIDDLIRHWHWPRKSEPLRRAAG